MMRREIIFHRELKAANGASAIGLPPLQPVCSGACRKVWCVRVPIAEACRSMYQAPPDDERRDRLAVID